MSEPADEQVDPFGDQMRELGEQDARRAEQLKTVADSVREHCAIVDDAVLGMYAAAAIARLAVRHGKTPRQVVEEMLAKQAFDSEDWPTTERGLKNLERVARQRYAGAGVALYRRDHSSN